MLWFWILVLVVILVGVITYFGLFYSGLQVENIEISGNQKIETASIKYIAEKNINQKLFGFLPTKSILIVSQNNLNNEILKAFPIIDKINIQRKFPQTIFIGIQERKPIGVYCDKMEKCYLIDQSGVVFEGLPNIPQDGLIVRQLIDDKEIFTGEKVISQNIISSIAKIQKNLKDSFQIDLREALISTPLRLDVQTSENWRIYFGTDPDSSINLQLIKLNSLLGGDITPEIRKNLQYIDLRFKDRAYYK